MTAPDVSTAAPDDDIDRPLDPPPAAEPAKPTLSSDHAALIKASAISDEVAAERGYRTITKKVDLDALGFSEKQRRVPALVLPVYTPSGAHVISQIRPDEPRIFDGKRLKYETPKGARLTLDVPPRVRPLLGDPRIPLFVTEGVRKADAGASIGLCIIDLLGVWSWRGSNVNGGKTVLADWDAIALNGRLVYLVFDSDVVEKRQVAHALNRLKGFLESRGASVRMVYLPPNSDGSKVGLDDFLATGKVVGDLLALATDEIREVADPSGKHPYEITPAGIVFNKKTEGGDATCILLANFAARITSDVVEDDGVETTRCFEIEIVRAGVTTTIRVPTSDFAPMAWPTKMLGAKAIVMPGMSNKDHLRAAIQFLSEEPPERRVFAHTGWREIDGQWLFLHAGGAIGVEGLRGDIETAPPANLSRFVLPAPSEGAELVAAVRDSLEILGSVKAEVAFCSFAACMRAVLGESDLTLHITGETGAFKTEFASVIQRFLGADMDADHLPAAWSGTANSLEMIAFAGKDVPLVVDDFVPTGSMDLQKLCQTAERLIRAKANAAGRTRLKSDATLRAPKPPRALLISTGEDVPHGHSLRARMFVLEVQRGDITPDALTKMQTKAAAGTYARAMSAFLQWLAGRRAETVRNLPRRVAELRDGQAAEGQHRRTPEAAANLFVGLETYLEFAVAVGAVTQTEADAINAEGRRVILAVAGKQADQQHDSDPVLLYTRLLETGFASGAAHLANTGGDAPDDAGSWGWRAAQSGYGTLWQAQGERVGWIVDDDIYLDATAAYRVVRKLSEDGGEGVWITPGTLKKRLRERGVLASVDTRGGAERLEIRRHLQGKRRNVLHLKADRFGAPDDGIGPKGTDGPIPQGETPMGDRPAPQAPNGDRETNESNDPAPAAPPEASLRTGDGPDGPHGPDERNDGFVDEVIS